MSRIPVPAHNNRHGPGARPLSPVPFPERSASPLPPLRQSQAPTPPMSTLSGSVAETRRKQSKRDEVSALSLSLVSRVLHASGALSGQGEIPAKIWRAGRQTCRGITAVNHNKPRYPTRAVLHIFLPNTPTFLQCQVLYHPLVVVVSASASPHCPRRCPTGAALDASGALRLPAEFRSTLMT